MPTEPFTRVRHEVKRYAAQASGEARFRAWNLTSEGRANGKCLRDLRGVYSGRRCFVMGNGPSLLKCDLNKLASEVTIVSNAHYLIWQQLSYIPTFLAVEDRLVAEDRADELRDLEGITKVLPFDLRRFIIGSRTAPLFLNFQRDYQPFPRFSRDLATRAYWGGTVSFLNLQLAAYLGCDPIILIGFDHSYVVPERDVVGSVIRSQGADVNHIHPDYFGPGYRWHDPNVARMEMAYSLARREAEDMGVQVVNASVGGQLEIFERAAFDTVV